MGGPPRVLNTKLYNGNIWPTKVLKEKGINKISAIFFSHFHTDHYSNFRSILNNFQVDNIIFNNEAN
ncbi:MBL fold metallo-hydrolase [Spiroplasma endosymbiont of Poecilobothrus nobilitatus]|uniref:MBL fold metallo-hydrolase n=1 Tax=Spiroplasma endosymbiont of Poecilobothrus nobilitatus TaxID=1209220 RepID=UPI00313B833F